MNDHSIRSGTRASDRWWCARRITVIGLIYFMSQWYQSMVWLWGMTQWYESMVWVSCMTQWLWLLLWRILVVFILLYCGYLVPSSVYERCSLSPLSLSFFLFSLDFPSSSLKRQLPTLFSLDTLFIRIHTTLISDFLISYHRINP